MDGFGPDGRAVTERRGWARIERAGGPAASVVILRGPDAQSDVDFLHRCPICFGLVAQDDRDDHIAWHGEAG